MADKIVLWLTAGVRLLWVLYPLERRAEVWQPGESQPDETLGMADRLDAQEVVPGFSIAVRKLQ